MPFVKLSVGIARHDVLPGIKHGNISVASENASSLPSTIAAGAQKPSCGSSKPPMHLMPGLTLPLLGHVRHIVAPVALSANSPGKHSLQLDAPAVDAIFPTVHSSHSPVFGFADEPAGQEPVQHWW